MRSIVGCISLCILNFVMVIPSTNDRANRNASSPSQQNTVPKKDLLGDPLPDGALMRLGTVRFRHGREITSAVFFHDGKTLATAGKDQIIRLWDSTTGQQLRRFDGHEYFLYAVALSPDGKLMATAEQEIYLWDLSTGKIIKKLGGGMGATWQLIFTPDSKSLISKSGDSTVRVWDIAKGTERHRFQEDRAIALTPDGKALVTGSINGTVSFRDIETGKLQQSFKASDDAIDSIALSANGKVLAVGGYDKKMIHVWNLDASKHVCQFAGHTDRVSAVVLTPDGKRLISGSGDRTIRIWDVDSGKQLHALTESAWVQVMAIAPDGKTFAAAADNVLRLRDSATGQERKPGVGHDQIVRSVAFVNSSFRLASGGDDGAVRLWDAKTGKELLHLTGHPRAVETVACSPDGSLIAAGGSHCPVHLWNISTGKLARILERTHGRGLAFSPDGTTLACGGRHPPDWEPTVELWDVLGGKKLRGWVATKYDAHALAFSPDGKLLASSTLVDRTIFFWDTSTGKLANKITEDLGACHSLLFANHGRQLISEGRKDDISFFDVTTGKESPRFSSIHGYPVLAISPDGRMLAAAAHGGNDLEIRVYEVSTGKERRRFQGHLGYVRALAFSSDSKLLATASDDTTVLIWDLIGG